MVRKKLVSRSSSIYLRNNYRRSWHSSIFGSYSYSSLLDTTISVRSLVKYSVIVLTFVIILGSVFLLGRMSTADKEVPEVKSTQLSGQTKQTVKEDLAIKEGTENISANKTVKKTLPVEKKTVVVNDTVEKNAIGEVVAAPEPKKPAEEKPSVPACSNKEAGFDYKYSKINITVDDFQKELRGDNWATLTYVRLTVTNDERCTIVNPTKVKLKINQKGKGSVWWDDDVFLPESFKVMLPGSTVSEVIPVHVSFSDIYSEKEFKMGVFDDYDIQMGLFRQYMIIK